MADQRQKSADNFKAKRPSGGGKNLKSFLVDGFLPAKLVVAYSPISVSVLQPIH